MNKEQLYQELKKRLIHHQAIAEGYELCINEIKYITTKTEFQEILSKPQEEQTQKRKYKRRYKQTKITEILKTLSGYKKTAKQIAKITGTSKHAVQDAICRLRKDGHNIETIRENGKAYYKYNPKIVQKKKKRKYTKHNFEKIKRRKEDKIKKILGAINYTPKSAVEITKELQMPYGTIHHLLKEIHKQGRVEIVKIRQNKLGKASPLYKAILTGRIIEKIEHNNNAVVSFNKQPQDIREL